jgi:hypothetical protein
LHFFIDQKKTRIKYNSSMFKLINKKGTELDGFKTLDSAMQAAKACGFFLTIKGPDFEVCGVFGVDAVANGVCPDGIAYDWNKASRIGATRRRK